MKRSYYLLFPLALSFFTGTFLTHGSSTIKKLLPSKDLPLEFQFLIQSLQNDEFSSSEAQEFLKIVQRMDKNFKAIPVKHIYFTLKSEIYKTILESSREQSPTPFPLDQKSIQLLQEKLSKDFKEYHSFGRWLIESTQSDLWDLGSDSSQISLNHKNNVKLKILRPWIELVLQNDPKNFTRKIRPLLWEILRNIDFTISLLFELTPFKYKNPPPHTGEFYFFDSVEKSMNIPSNLSEKEEEMKTEDDFRHYQQSKKIEAEKMMKELIIQKESSADGSTGGATGETVDEWRPR